MKNIKWVFVLYSLGAILSMFMIGVAVGVKSYLLALAAIISLIMIMGNGFKTKKKYREQGLL
ncbi:YlaF family protein [Sporosarcina aquimarina]|uniref:YlaF family protein n=1 Tax=Sporosarcina aquimarina TaxID=114975 RepID=A0ABU4G118_9BACL|nr:YlaF family protein [Sporosarcina aquimarina]MDW0109357.1 YlaF family protein [Sporosarcina aquimarina]